MLVRIIKGKNSNSARFIDNVVVGIRETPKNWNRLLLTILKFKFKTSRGVVEYISIPVGSNLGRYSDVGVSDILRKIYLWSKDNTEELEEMLRSNNISTVEIVKDGPGTLELKG